MDVHNPFRDLALQCPSFTPAEAALIGRDLFAVEGTITELGSNQDRNYRVDAADGRWVLKIANPGWARAALEAQNAAMLHLHERGLPFEVPVPRPAPGGELIVPLAREGESFDTRLVSYVEGNRFQDAPYHSPAALRAHGRLAAQTTRALADFAHPGLERTIQWDLQHAGAVVDALASHVRSDARRAQARHMIATSDELLEPLRARLRTQAVHADCTDYNVMAAPDRAGRMMPTGLIDFGDLVSSYRISDIAAGAQSLMLHAPQRALAITAEVARGFHEELALDEAEVDAIWALVLARAAVIAVCEEHQAALEPDNPYAQEALDDGWGVADGLGTIPPALARETLRDALGFERSPAARAAAGRVAELAAAGVVAPLAVAPGAIVDLSVSSDELRFGDWEQPAAIAALLIAAGPGAVGRWGEARLIHAVPETHDPPAAVHLGVDLFAERGEVVRAPLGGTVVGVGARDVVLDVGGLGLRLAAIVPGVAEGDVVEAGEEVGTLASPLPGDPLPAHLHVQALADPGLAPPGLARPGEAAGWRALCPDPSALLGVPAGPPPSDPRGLAERRDRVFATVQERYFDEAPQIERGWRQHLYDTDGRVYLDAVNNVAILGHSHPGVAAAVARQLRLLNTNSRFHYELLVEFCERLTALTPAGLDAVLLVGSGSEANDVALRLVRCATGQRDMLTIQSAYHGWTVATDEVSTSVYDNPLAAERRPSWIHPIESPNIYRGRHRGHDAGALYAQDADRALAEITASGAGVAGFIAETLYGNAGGVPLPDGYLQRVYGAVRAAGGLCIADEVQVGYGRLGSYFWGFEQQGVVPDVITIAKATGNGFPVGAVITTRAIAQAFEREGAFFSSTGGSPASCASALAVLDALDAEGLQENARVVGAHLRGRLEELCERHAICGTVHGMGLYLGLELIRDPQTLEPASQEAYAICERMRELGVIVQPTSDGTNVLKIKPPLCITRASADYLADTLDHVLSTGW